MNWIIMPYIDVLTMTARAIDDCLAQTIGRVQVLAIDNGSQELYARADHAVHFWRHAPPLPSLSATWNLALRTIWEAGGDYALVVNNDVRLHPQLYEALRETQQETRAWFVSACNIAPRTPDPSPILPWDGAFLESRGGPDFSCFLITRECHKWFQFDEGFIPAYHEDNDYHRRLILAGFGEKIFSVPVPYLHYGSATCTRSAEVRAAWGERFKGSQAYYREKWGGMPHKETYVTPFNTQAEDMRLLMTGQGTPQTWGKGAEIFGL